VTLRKLIGIAPVVAALAFAAPVASASAQTTSTSGPGSAIPCYPYPAFCGPNGQPWFSLPTFSPPTFQFPLIQLPPLTTAPTVHFGPGPVQLPTAG
jgi:hypothetical protein